MFQNNTRLGNNFHFKDRVPKDFLLMSFINFNVDYAMSLIRETLECRNW